MIRFYCATLVLLFLSCSLSAQQYKTTPESRLAEKYGTYMQEWINNEEAQYREDIESLCEGKKKTLIATDAARILAKKENQPADGTYEFQSYLNWLEKSSEGLNVSYSNFRAIDQKKIQVEMKKDKNKAKHMTFISCEATFKGDINSKSKELLYIRKSQTSGGGMQEQISKIGRYVEKDGKTLVDLSDIPSISTLGVAYNYDQHFPVGASIIAQSGFLSLSFDFGLNNEDKTYVSEEMDIKNIMEFTAKRTTRDPKCFLTLTPGFFLKYVSIGCGLGVVYSDGTEETAEGAVHQNGTNMSSTFGTSSSDGISPFDLMVRPQVRAFIPVFRPMKLSVGAGYDFVPARKDLNGYNFSFGLHWDCDVLDLFN